MSQLVSYEKSGSVAAIGMDDGKVNVMSPAMLRALHEAFDRAESERAIVLLHGRSGIFSAGFDLKVFARGDAEEIHSMLKLGSELAARILEFPTPVVAACAGNAFPMGAFLLLASDLRFGVDGPYKLGLNEVAIGIVVPRFAVELARHRLTPPCFQKTVLGEMVTPTEAVAGGFLDRLVEPAELQSAAHAAAEALTKLDRNAHAETKRRVRAPAIAAIREAIDAEITLETYRAATAQRAASA
jgi:enoyl-CoA hydratase/carnithine racemase